MLKPFRAEVVRAPGKKGEWLLRVTSINRQRGLWSETYKRRAAAIKAMAPLDPERCAFFVEDTRSGELRPHTRA